MSKVKSIFLLSLLVSQACQYEFPEPDEFVPGFETGSADFSNLVILGGSVGAGYMDGSLYTDGQDASYSLVIVNQINSISSEGLIFVQPDIDSENGWNQIESDQDLKGRYVLEFIGPDLELMTNVPNDGEFPQIFDTDVGLNNFSVPFLRSHQVLSLELWNNPYYGRFGSEPGNSILLDDLISSQPTLVLVDIGTEDIIGYAAHGLTGELNPPEGQIGPKDRTPVSVFSKVYNQIISRLLAETNATLVVSTIPDVSKFPFFHSYGSLAGITAGEAATLNSQRYAEYNLFVGRFNSGAIIRRPRIQFFSDDSPLVWFLVVEDPSLPDIILENGNMFSKIRQMINGDQLLWSTPEVPVGLGFGTVIPIPKKYWISVQELKENSELVEAYNQIIEETAQTDSRISLFDAYSFYDEIFKHDAIFDGVLFTPDISRTGIFSADALNLNQRGSALIANSIIDHLNSRFESNIPLTDVNEFKGNRFQNGF